MIWLQDYLYRLEDFEACRPSGGWRGKSSSMVNLLQAIALFAGKIWNLRFFEILIRGSQILPFKYFDDLKDPKRFRPFSWTNPILLVRWPAQSKVASVMSIWLFGWQTDGFFLQNFRDPSEISTVRWSGSSCSWDGSFLSIPFCVS